MEEIIYARIVKIVSDTQVLIDKGESNGVRKGMKFVIYDEGEEIKDPLTSKSLGRVEIQKGIVIVKQTMPGLSLLETEERLVRKEVSTTQTFKSLPSINPTIPQYTVERVKERLTLDPNSLMAVLFRHRPVILGDKVRSILE